VSGPRNPSTAPAGPGGPAAGLPAKTGLRERLVGTWEQVSPGEGVSLEFAADETLTIRRDGRPALTSTWTLDGNRLSWNERNVKGGIYPVQFEVHHLVPPHLVLRDLQNDRLLTFRRQ
jgi:hypothetical protein